MTTFASLTTNLTTATVTLGGLAWDPGLRGALTVVLAVSILMGSIYLILATNTGARLGLLIALAGLAGWMVILTTYWTVSPPGIGPSGPLPSWKPVEVIYDTPGADPVTDIVETLPSDEERAAIRDEILAANPDVELLFKSTPSLSEIAGENSALTEDLELNGWTVVSASSAGEAQAAADAALKEMGIFADPTEYKKLAVYEIGGKPVRDSDAMTDRVISKIEQSVWFRHPPHYQIVQVQPVIPQETKPGEAPPTPIIDETQPVITIVLVRDLGNQRGKPAIYLVISLAFFIIFTLMLHFRDKTLDRNVAAAEAAKKKG